MILDEANGKNLMKGLLTRQPRKRLGSGLGGWEASRLHCAREVSYGLRGFRKIHLCPFGSCIPSFFGLGSIAANETVKQRCANCF